MFGILSSSRAVSISSRGEKKKKKKNTSLDSIEYIGSTISISIRAYVNHLYGVCVVLVLI